jgi:hypothetical protein
MVESSLNYVARPDERLYFYLYPPPTGTEWRNSVGDRHTMQIHDARTLSPAPTLDTEGFSVVNHNTAAGNLYDDAVIRETYYPEMERLVAAATGATKVRAFDHNVRCADRVEEPESVAQNPVRLVHNDYTHDSGPQRVRDLFDPREAEQLLQHRFSVINVWKPIRGPVRTTPLAVCDAQSLSQNDFVLTDLRYQDRTGEIYSIAFNEKHKWFYYPEMREDEAMLLKCYDSEMDRARFTAHTAFDDPDSPADGPARESIEVRTLAFFKDDE